jgi:hypothetical protein
MPVQANRAYNDPALGRAFSSLAGIFAPPSGTDAAGWSLAQQRLQQNSRLAEIYAAGNDPTVPREVFDRRAIAAGLYHPNQGYYAVDTTAATSRANNAADNERALTTNLRDNQRHLIERVIAPVAQDAIRPALTPEQAAIFGVPAAPEFRGNLTLRTGEIALTPDGQRHAGPTAPLNSDQVVAAAMQSQLSPDQIAMRGLTGTGVQNVETPEGPRVVPNVAAVGQAPVFAQSRFQNGTVTLPSGQTIPVLQGPDGRWRNAQTNQPIPEGLEVRQQARPQGPLDAVTAANRTSANNRAAELTRTLGTLDLYEALITQNPGAIGIPGLIRGTAQNAVGVVNDLTRAFGDRAPALQGAAEEIRQGLRGVAPGLFDPSIPEAQFLQGTLAYALARTENPSGEVSRQAYERALERIQGGFLQNTESSRAAVGAMRRVAEQELNAIGVLRNPTGARTDAGFREPGAAPAGAPRSGATPPPPGPIPQVRSMEEANQLAPGTRFRDPNGVVRVRP